MAMRPIQMKYVDRSANMDLVCFNRSLVLKSYSSYPYDIWLILFNYQNLQLQ